MITNITKAAEAVVTCADYNQDDGQVIGIYGEGGMTEVNNRFYKLARIDQDHFKLVGTDSTTWSNFTGGAMFCPCFPTERVSWKIVSVTGANPAVVELDQKPSLPNSTRVGIHAVANMTQLESANAYLKAVPGQPTKYELYADAGLTVGLDSSGFSAHAGGGGYVTEYVAPDDMVSAFYFNKSTDNKLKGNRCRAIQLGVDARPANSTGYGFSFDDNHFHNFTTDGSLFAHYWMGGKNRFDLTYVDGPTRYGFILEGLGNDIDKIQAFHNPGTVWPSRDKFPILVRTMNGGAAAMVQGGIIEGGPTSRYFSDHVGPGSYNWLAVVRSNVFIVPPNSIAVSKVVAAGDATKEWSIDSSAIESIIAQGGTLDLQTGSGVFAITANQQTGFSAFCIAGNSGIDINGNNATADALFLNTLAPAAGKIGIAVTGNRIRITNNYGAQITICIAGFRTRSVI